VDAETRAYLDQTLGVFRNEFSRGFANLHQEFGALHQEFGSLRQEFGALHQEFGALRQEFGSLRQEFGTVREEFGTLRADFDELRREVRESAAETRRHFDVVAEDLRHDIRGIAEGVIALSERVDRLGVSVRAEMNERFTATHAVVRVAFSDVRRDIAELRSRL
jgi:predicted nuclease with TOPRIM domain